MAASTNNRSRGHIGPPASPCPHTTPRSALHGPSPHLRNTSRSRPRLRLQIPSKPPERRAKMLHYRRLGPAASTVTHARSAVEPNSPLLNALSPSGPAQARDQTASRASIGAGLSSASRQLLGELLDSIETTASSVANYPEPVQNDPTTLQADIRAPSWDQRRHQSWTMIVLCR
jgi:hypothetical protein